MDYLDDMIDRFEEEDTKKKKKKKKKKGGQVEEIDEVDVAIASRMAFMSGGAEQQVQADRQMRQDYKVVPTGDGDDEEDGEHDGKGRKKRRNKRSESDRSRNVQGKSVYSKGGRSKGSGKAYKVPDETKQTSTRNDSFLGELSLFIAQHLLACTIFFVGMASLVVGIVLFLDESTRNIGALILWVLIIAVLTGSIFLCFACYTGKAQRSLEEDPWFRSGWMGCCHAKRPKPIVVQSAAAKVERSKQIEKTLAHQ